MSERRVQHDFLGELFDDGIAEDPRHKALHELIAPYFSASDLQFALADRRDIREVLRHEVDVPEPIVKLLDTLKLILTPLPGEQIRTPNQIAGILMLEMGSLMQEQFRVVCLDTKNRIRRIHLVYQGTLDTSHIRPAEVLKMPIHLSSSSVIFAHNHPSNDPTPSPEDELITRQLVEACRLHGIEALDHIVVAQSGYCSMRERGLGFDRKREG